MANKPNNTEDQLDQLDSGENQKPRPKTFSDDVVDITDNDELLVYFNSLKEAGEKRSKKFRMLALRNENWLQGNQTVDYNSQGSQVNQLVYAWQDYLPPVIQNHLPNLVNTWKARQVQQRPSVTAWPTSTDERSLASSEISRKLIEYEEKEIQIDLQLDDIVGLMATGRNSWI